jgi:hypothetical protein
MAEDSSQKTRDRSWYINQFKSNKCMCGKFKHRRKAFCLQCFQALPRDTKLALYSPFGGGYEGAVDEAVQFLQTEAW